MRELNRRVLASFLKTISNIIQTEDDISCQIVGCNSLFINYKHTFNQLFVQMYVQYITEFVCIILTLCKWDKILYKFCHLHTGQILWLKMSMIFITMKRVRKLLTSTVCWLTLELTCQLKLCEGSTADRLEGALGFWSVKEKQMKRKSIVLEFNNKPLNYNVMPLLYWTGKFQRHFCFTIVAQLYTLE